MSKRTRLERAAQAKADTPADYPGGAPEGFWDDLGKGATGLTVRESGLVEMGPFTLSSIGLHIDGEIEADEWERMFALVCRIKGAVQWMLGDLLAYRVQREWGVTYEAYAERTGYTVETLRNLAWVCSNVDVSWRHDELTFQHHYAVASLPPDQQRDWLARAVDNHWSTRQLAAVIAGGDPPTPSRGLVPRMANFLARNRLRYEGFRRAIGRAGESEKSQISQLLDAEIDYLTALKREVIGKSRR